MPVPVVENFPRARRDVLHDFWGERRCEKLGVTSELERCRNFLCEMEGEMEGQSIPGDSDPHGEFSGNGPACSSTYFIIFTMWRTTRHRPCTWTNAQIVDKGSASITERSARSYHCCQPPSLFPSLPPVVQVDLLQPCIHVSSFNSQFILYRLTLSFSFSLFACTANRIFSFDSRKRKCVWGDYESVPHRSLYSDLVVSI